MIGESKYSNKVMKKHFNKELVMTREYDEDFNAGSVMMTILILMLK